MPDAQATAPRPGVLRGLAAAARRVPSVRGDGACHPSTLWRWIKRGVRLSDGSQLRLSARALPGGWAVSDEALDEFIDRLTADRTGDPAQASAPRSPSRRQKDLARVDRELEALGV